MFKTTLYFEYVRQRPDRALIEDAWIRQAITNPLHEEVQADGRIRGQD